MTSKGTDLGIYIVLDFGPEHKANLSGVNEPGVDAAGMGISMALQLAANDVGPFVRVAFLDVSRQLSPSKL